MASIEPGSGMSGPNEVFSLCENKSPIDEDHNTQTATHLKAKARNMSPPWFDLTHMFSTKELALHRRSGCRHHTCLSVSECTQPSNLGQYCFNSFSREKSREEDAIVDSLVGIKKISSGFKNPAPYYLRDRTGKGQMSLGFPRRISPALVT
jgi:hypothetical protein